MKNRKIKWIAAVCALGLLTAGCGEKSPAAEAERARVEGPAAETESARVEGPAAETGSLATESGGAEERAGETAEDTGGQVAAGDETSSRIDVVKPGIEPVYAEALKDGVYPVKVDSSSSMFQVTACALTVKDGAMRAVMTMKGTGYLKLYMGTGQEAAGAAEADYIPFVENADGTHSFEVPIKALDMGIDCSAFSKKKEKWYDRVLVFRADSLPAAAFAEGALVTAESLELEDGEYTMEVTLGGGSGRARVESPARLRVEGGNAFATIVWGSSNYDYMVVDGQKYEFTGAEGNSTFEIPVAGFDRSLPVIADTIAMSEPHEVSYTLNFDSATLKRVER